MAPLCDPDLLQALLDVEVALAVAQAEAGIIPRSCIPDIQAEAKAAKFDGAALLAASATDGNIVISLVKKLTEAVAARSVESSRHVHRGATSQDILDTALVLRLRATGEAVQTRLTRIMTTAATHARTHVTTPMPGRTWLQHASPTTFGLKAAGWLDMIGRCRVRLDEAIQRGSVVQLGGASGTLAALGDDAARVTEAFANQLHLKVPASPWHTQRDRIVDVCAALGIVCGALGKIGRDLTLLAQSEVAEAIDGGGGGSSSMPHKQNPVRAVIATAAALRAPGLVATMLSAMPQEHERAAGGWQAEWPTVAELIALTTESAEAIAGALEDLHIDTSAMRQNLTINNGVAMAEPLSTALAAHMSRTDAMRLVERLVSAAVRDGRPLREVATADPEVTRWLSAPDIERSLNPENFLGSSRLFVDRVLTQWALLR